MTPGRLAALLVALVLALAGCAASRDQVRLEASPTATRADEPVAFRVTGLRPGTPVVLDLHSVDAKGVAWDARATFVADAAGTVDPAAAAPSAGYLGVDAMGLFTSLAPQASAPSYRWPDDGPAAFDLSVERAGKVLATARLGRTLWTARPTVTTLTKEHDGFVGTYVVPVGVQRGPAVLALGGSEGGDPLIIALILASRGIPSLSVAYFGLPGLPPRLSPIPLEYFETPLRWLRGQPEVDPDRLWIAGGSRGSEAAALVAADHPDLVHGLLDLSPSSVGGCAYEPGSGDLCPGPGWTRGGRPVPYTSVFSGTDPERDRSAAIAVEKIDGPVLTLCGGSDLLWSSCQFSGEIQDRLRAHGFRHPTLALSYPEAGHFIDFPIPYYPVGPAAPDALPTYGATPLANDQARADAWPKLLAFVRR